MINVWRSYSTLIFEKNCFFMFAWVHSIDKPSWILVVVYGDASYQQNPMIWAEITILTSWNRPICCVGDFNAITSPLKKVGGNPTLNHNSVKFNKFIFNVGLINLGYKGSAYTWTNKTNGSNAIHARLDRVLVNIEWCGAFLDAYVTHMFRKHSDHTNRAHGQRRSF
jgi:endonuclease/exonuclease/phosphatase family metal-dependent hydrolase